MHFSALMVHLKCMSISFSFFANMDIRFTTIKRRADFSESSEFGPSLATGCSFTLNLQGLRFKHLDVTGHWASTKHAVLSPLRVFRGTK